MEYTVSKKAAAHFAALTDLEKVQKALAFLKADHERCVREQVEITKIPAPTFHEERRAAYMAQQFEALGLTEVHTDEVGNITGVRKGSAGDGRRIVIDGHMDTVYAEDTKLEPTFDGEFIHCPGIVDDTRALAAMLSILRALNDAGVQTEADLVFLGTVREEGVGAFGGSRAFFEAHPDITASVHMDGCGAAGIIYQSTGIKTIGVTFHGIGGHAYLAFGDMANPLHAAARAVAKIADLQVPTCPKTTFCVSNFHAGSDAAIHAIVPEATIKINYRSNGEKELLALDKEVFRCIEEACAEESARWGKDTITYTVETYFDVRAGALDDHAPLVEAAWSAAASLGNQPFLVEGGPTNASIPIGMGIPAVCIGDDEVNVYAHNAAKERFPVKNTWQMPQMTLLVVLSAAGVAGGPGTVLQ